MKWIYHAGVIAVFLVVKLSAKAQTDTLFIEPWNNGHAVYLLPAGAKLPEAFHSDQIIYPEISKYRKFKSTFPRHYVPAYSYKGEWVMYDPCDGIADFQAELTDSTWINYYYDEPSAMPLESVEFELNNSIEFMALQYNWEDPTMSIEHAITIERSELKGLYYVTFTNLVNRSSITNAFIDLNEAHRFRYLVNACTFQKELEFSGFDE
jgi:hypothetical protein